MDCSICTSGSTCTRKYGSTFVRKYLRRYYCTCTFVQHTKEVQGIDTSVIGNRATYTYDTCTWSTEVRRTFVLYVATYTYIVAQPYFVRNYFRKYLRRYLRTYLMKVATYCTYSLHTRACLCTNVQAVYEGRCVAVCVVCSCMCTVYDVLCNCVLSRCVPSYGSISIKRYVCSCVLCSRTCTVKVTKVRRLACLCHLKCVELSRILSLIYLGVIAIQYTYCTLMRTLCDITIVNACSSVSSCEGSLYESTL